MTPQSTSTASEALKKIRAEPGSATFALTALRGKGAPAPVQEPARIADPAAELAPAVTGPEPSAPMSERQHAPIEWGRLSGGQLAMDFGEVRGGVSAQAGPPLWSRGFGVTSRTEPEPEPPSGLPPVTGMEELKNIASRWPDYMPMSDTEIQRLQEVSIATSRIAKDDYSQKARSRDWWKRLGRSMMLGRSAGITLDLAATGGAAERVLSAKELKARDIKNVQAYLDQMEFDMRPKTMGAKFAGGVAFLFPYMVEFIATGAVADMITKGLLKPGPMLKAALKAKSILGKAGYTGVALSQIAGRSLAQAALSPQRWGPQYEKARMPQLHVTKDGELALRLPTESAWKSFGKAFGEMWVEYYSEHLGAAFIAGGEGALMRLAARGGIGSRGAKRMLDVMRRSSPGGWQRLVDSGFERAGWNGWVAEVMEERAGDVMREAFGIQQFPGKTKAEKMYHAAWPGWENMFVEFGVLAVPAAGRVALRQAGGLLNNPANQEATDDTDMETMLAHAQSMLRQREFAAKPRGTLPRGFIEGEVRKRAVPKRKAKALDVGPRARYRPSLGEKVPQRKDIRIPKKAEAVGEAAEVKAKVREFTADREAKAFFAKRPKLADPQTRLAEYHRAHPDASVADLVGAILADDAVTGETLDAATILDADEIVRHAGFASAAHMIEFVTDKKANAVEARRIQEAQEHFRQLMERATGRPVAPAVKPTAKPPAPPSPAVEGEKPLLSEYNALKTKGTSLTSGEVQAFAEKLKGKSVKAEEVRQLARDLGYATQKNAPKAKTASRILRALEKIPEMQMRVKQIGEPSAAKAASLSKMTVADIRKELADAGHRSTGNRPALVERLRAVRERKEQPTPAQETARKMMAREADVAALLKRADAVRLTGEKRKGMTEAEVRAEVKLREVEKKTIGDNIERAQRELVRERMRKAELSGEALPQLPPFVEKPTLEDLEAYAAFQREIDSRIDALTKRIAPAQQRQEKAQGRIARSGERMGAKLAKTGDIESGMDAVHRAEKSRNVVRESEREIEALRAQIASLRKHARTSSEYDVQATDWQQYLSRGKELPAERRAIYERNAAAKPELSGEAKARARIEKAKKDITGKLGRLHAGIDPTLVVDMARYILGHVELKVRQFATILRQAYADFPTADRKRLELHMRAAWRQTSRARSEIRELTQQGALEDIPAAVTAATTKLRLGALATPRKLLRYAEGIPKSQPMKWYLAGARDVVDLHRDLHAYAKSKLLNAEVERIFRAITKARTPMQRARVIASINILAERQDRNAAMRELKQAIKDAKAEKRKGMRPKEKEKLDRLLDGLATSKRSFEKIRQMRGLMEMLKVESDPDIPNKVIEYAKAVLTDVNARLLTPDGIRQVSQAIQHIVFLNTKKQQAYFGQKAKTVAAENSQATDEVEGRFTKLQKVKPGELIKPFRLGWFRYVAGTGQLSVNSVAQDLGGREGVVYDVLVTRTREGRSRFFSFQAKAMDHVRRELEKMGFTIEEADEWAGEVFKVVKEAPSAGILAPAVTGELRHTVKTPLPLAYSLTRKGQRQRIKTIELTRAHRVDLINHLSDPSTRAEILRNRSEGIYLNNFEGRPIKLMPADIAALEKSFTTREKAVAAAMKSFLTGEGKDLLNEAWLMTHGFEIALRDNYWPRKRSWEFQEKEPDKIVSFWTQDMQLDAQGIFKGRVGGLQPILVSDAFGKFQTHINRVGAMYGKHAPVMDALRLLGDPEFVFAVKQRVPDGARKLALMRMAMKEYRGLEVKGGGQYQAGLAQFIRRAHTGILGFSPHIAAYQVVSLYNATVEMSGKDVFKVWNWRLPTSAERAAMMKSPILRARFEGNAHQIFTPEFAQASRSQFYFGKERGLGNKSMKWIKWMDELAITNIHRAALSEGKRKGYVGEGLAEYALRRTEEVVDLTQPTWDPITSSFLAIEGRNSIIAKLATMFSSQRSKNFNIGYRAVSDFRHSEKTWRDFVELGRKMSILALQAIMIYGIGEFAWTQYLDDDDERSKAWAEHVFGALARFMGNWVVVGDAVTTVAKAVRTSREDKPEFHAEPRLNVLAKGWWDSVASVHRLDQAFQDLAENKEHEEKWRKGEPKTKDSFIKAADKIASPASVFGGLPIRTAWRVARSRIAALRTDKPNIVYYERIEKGLKSGDDDAAKAAIAKLKSRGAVWRNVRQSLERRKVSKEQYQRASKLWDEVD